MKILYAIQGTGNGHMTCAREVLPLLKKRADVDVLVSGTQVDVDMPWPVTFRMEGLGFVFGKKGGIDYLETYRKGSIKRLFREIQSLPVDDYDLVISDFEPVSAWACYLKHKPCIGFSHQAAVTSKKSPRPRKIDPLGKAVLKYYAPASLRYGFHYLPYGKNIFTPIIRREVRELTSSNKGHYTVYLPAYSDKKIICLLSRFPQVQWEVFSKHSKEAYRQDHIQIRPVQHDAFLKSMAAAEGVLCGAGFQTPAEVIYLRKKLLAVPMKGQYEQQCNGAALRLLGVPVLKNLKLKQFKKVKQWLESEQRVVLDFPDETQWILDQMLEEHSKSRKTVSVPMHSLTSASRFREFLIKKIFYQAGS